MSMIAKLLHRITRNLPYRQIAVGGRAYLDRYYAGSLLGLRFYIHNFKGSDPGRGPHDHPYSSLSLVLAGGYWEEVVTKLDTSWCIGYHTRRKWRGAGRINWIPAGKFHRITNVKPGGNTWTLFVSGPRRKGWGFMETLPEGGGFTYRLGFDDPGGDQWWKRAGTRADMEDSA